MTTLPAPLRESLREPFTDGDLAPLWPRVEARRDRRRAARAWGPVAVAAAAALALLAVRHRRPVAPAGPLHLSNGAAVPVLDGDRPERSVALDDRSRLTLSAGAHLEPRRNDARTFDTALDRGRVRFDVQPRGPRAWSVDCGLAVVRVVGTSFALERSPGRLHVEVFHGLVRVEGERVPGRARLLAAGESLDVTAADASPAAPAIAAAPAAPVAPVAPRAPRPRPEAWRALAARRDFGAAYDALGPGGAESRARTATADDLLALGEVAHRSHHYAEAAGLYERFVGEHAGHPEAAMVGFTLGRLQLDQLASPRDAARTLDRARRGAVPRYLLEDVLARLVEARARSGDAAGARAAAEEYARAFPGGRRAVDVRRWSE
jgi:transmembrane sensor